MNIEELTNTVNDIFFNDTSSFKTIASKQKELLAIAGACRDITTIDNKFIEKYLAYLKSKQNKPATINAKMMYLSKCLKYAYRMNLIRHKPYIPTIKITAIKDKFLTEEEYKTMLAYAKSKNKELYQVLVLGYNTGMRISNILMLKKTDIENGYIRIYHNKTNNPYSIPMNETVLKLMQNFTEFNSNYRQIQYKFDVMIKELKLDKRITIHTLRHTTCSKLVEKGVPLPVVQAIMNHKNIKTTLRYNHLKNKQLEMAVDVL